MRPEGKKIMVFNLCCGFGLTLAQDLRYSVGDPRAVLLRVCEMIGVQLSPSALSELVMKPNSFEIVYPDIQSIGASIKHMGLVEYSTAHVLLMNAKEKSTKETDANEVERLLELSRDNFTKAMQSGINNPRLETELKQVLDALNNKNTLRQQLDHK